MRFSHRAIQAVTFSAALAVPLPFLPGCPGGPPLPAPRPTVTPIPLPAPLDGAGARHGQTVSYLGRHYVVPYSWPVIDLAKDPTTCVRFDTHAVYLGVPSAAQDCPAHGVGRRVGALLIEPQSARAATAAGSARAATVSLDQPTSGEIDVSAPGVSILASYADADRSTVVDAITGAGLPQPANAAAAPATAPVEVVKGTYQVTGLGFDTCTAPSAAQMKAWATSPFTTVGIYIGGSERACSQPNLTASWIAAQAKAGWHFMPLYAGWQAAWDSLTATKTTPAPATLGTQSADDAINHARALGFGTGSLLHYDMESYTTAAQRTAAMAFLSSWTAELHKKGYKSAVYSSASTGIADLVARRGKMTEPDVIDIAHWNNVADSDPKATPADAWPGQRTHQYAGNLDATYGGVKINIDKDYLSLAPGCVGPTPAPTPTPKPTPKPTPTPSPKPTPPSTPTPSPIQPSATATVGGPVSPSPTPPATPSATPSATAPAPPTGTPSTTPSPAPLPPSPVPASLLPSGGPGFPVSVRAAEEASNRLDAC